jgi:hypothetical protein
MVLVPELAKIKDRLMSLDFWYKNTGSNVIKNQLSILKKEYTKKSRKPKLLTIVGY